MPALTDTIQPYSVGGRVTRTRAPANPRPAASGRREDRLAKLMSVFQGKAGGGGGGSSRNVARKAQAASGKTGRPARAGGNIGQREGVEREARKHAMKYLETGDEGALEKLVSLAGSAIGKVALSPVSLLNFLLNPNNRPGPAPPDKPKNWSVKDQFSVEQFANEPIQFIDAGGKLPGGRRPSSGRGGGALPGSRQRHADSPKAKGKSGPPPGFLKMLAKTLAWGPTEILKFLGWWESHKPTQHLGQNEHPHWKGPRIPPPSQNRISPETLAMSEPNQFGILDSTTGMRRIREEIDEFAPADWDETDEVLPAIMQKFGLTEDQALLEIESYLRSGARRAGVPYNPRPSQMSEPNVHVMQFDLECMQERLDRAAGRKLRSDVWHSRLPDGVKLRLMQHVQYVQFSDEGAERASVPLEWLVDTVVQMADPRREAAIRGMEAPVLPRHDIHNKIGSDEPYNSTGGPYVRNRVTREYRPAILDAPDIWTDEDEAAYRDLWNLVDSGQPSWYDVEELTKMANRRQAAKGGIRPGQFADSDPPNLRVAGETNQSSSCAACKHFDQTSDDKEGRGKCKLYQATVFANQTCDSFEDTDERKEFAGPGVMLDRESGEPQYSTTGDSKTQFGD